MITRKPWKTLEHAMFLKLIGQGKTCAEVGRVLGRSHSSIRSRKMAFAVKKPKHTPIKIIGATVRILTHEVPDWYALGWRFDGFIPGGLCRMEWRSGRPERRPVVARELVAA